MARKKKQPNRFLAYLRHHKWVTIVFGTFAFIMLLIGFLNTFVFLPVKDPNLGVTFTREESEHYGLDWKANFTALLDDMGLKHFRLTSYWSTHEKVRREFDFSDLDWELNEAAKRGATVD